MADKLKVSQFFKYSWFGGTTITIHGVVALLNWLADNMRDPHDAAALREAAKQIVKDA